MDITEEPGPPRKEDMSRKPIEKSVLKQPAVEKPREKKAEERPFTMEVFTEVFLEFLEEEDLPKDREYDTETLEDCGIDELALCTLAEKLKDAWPSRGGKAARFRGGKLIDLFNFMK